MPTANARIQTHNSGSFQSSILLLQRTLNEYNYGISCACDIEMKMCEVPNRSDTETAKVYITCSKTDNDQKIQVAASGFSFLDLQAKVSKVVSALYKGVHVDDSKHACDSAPNTGRITDNAEICMETQVSNYQMTVSNDYVAMEVQSVVVHLLESVVTAVDDISSGKNSDKKHVHSRNETALKECGKGNFTEMEDELTINGKYEAVENFEMSEETLGELETNNNLIEKQERKMIERSLCTKELNVSDLEGRDVVNTLSRPEVKYQDSKESNTDKEEYDDNVSDCSDLAVIMYECEYCEERYVQYDDFVTHVRNQHFKTKKTFKCSTCEKLYCSKVRLATHMESHSEENKFGCAHCTKAFTVASDLIFHLRIHMEKIVFKCKFCDKTSNSLNTSQKHLIRFHKEESGMKLDEFQTKRTTPRDLNSKLLHRCKRCKIAFKNHVRLRRHLKLHKARKRQHGCEVISQPKRFPAAERLPKHVPEPIH